MSATPRPELLALLADCKEHPHEDGLRLILADWLEENGTPVDQARAELIRCQVEFSRLPAEEPTRNEVGRRARLLQQRHGSDWLGPLAPWFASTTWRCQRGLLSVPLEVDLLRSQSLPSKASSEAWAWVEEVYIVQARDEHFARIGQSPLLDGPTSLGFVSSQLGPAGLQALGQMRWLRRMIRLDLGRQALTSPGLRTLVQSPHLGRLRELELTGGGLDAQATRHLAAAECAHRLERLVLWGNRLGDPGAVELAAPGSLERLAVLDLRNNGIGESGVRALAGCAALKALRVLELADNRIGPDGAAALAMSPNLAKLESLVLWGNPIGTEGVRLLVERFGSRVHVSPGGA